MGLRTEAERLWDRAPRVSLVLADAMISVAECYELPAELALGHLTRGDSLRYLGEHARAADELVEAGDRYLALGDQVGWARTRTGRALALQRLGRGREGLGDLPRAHRILVREREWLRAAALMLNVGSVFGGLGEFERARRAYARALRYYARAALQDPSRQSDIEIRVAKAHVNQANVEALLGHFDAALHQQERALRIFRQADDRVLVLRCEHSIALLYLGWGRYVQALQLLTQAQATAQDEGLELEHGMLQIEMAECHLRLNRDERALNLAEQARDKFERKGLAIDVARADLYRALVYTRGAEWPRAVDLLGSARQVFERAGMAPMVGLVGVYLGLAYLEMGAWSQALAEAERASDAFASRGLLPHEAQADLVAAEACLGLNHPTRARALARSALDRVGHSHVSWLAANGHYLLGRAAHAEGARNLAAAEYEEAVRAVEQNRIGNSGEISTRFLDDKMRIFDAAIDLALSQDRVADALGYLERGKSRVLVDYVLRGDDEQPLDADARGLVAQLARARQEHHWYFSQLNGGIVPSQTDTPSALSREALTTALRSSEQRIADLLEGLDIARARAGPYSAVTGGATHWQPTPSSEGAAIVEYCFAASRWTVFLKHTDRVRSIPLPVTDAELQHLMLRFDDNRQTALQLHAHGLDLDGLTRQSRAILRALYRVLFEPLASCVDPALPLAIIPYGALHGLPFHALFDGDQYLAQRFEMTTCPSSVLLDICQRRQRRPPASALVLGHSADGRLPHALAEARVVTHLLPGACYLEAEATPAALAKNASEFAVVHLAAHGEARLDNPIFSHLQLAGGFLQVADVLSLPLNGALVTLSGCETGLPSVTRGDEVLGLSRGFLHAGASAVIHSLWQVDDVVARQQMTTLYGQIGRGIPPAAALRTAQCETLQRLPHPALWAPFQLVGAR
jgi:CHAT domain-containing protein